MGRPREFDEDQALRSAMVVFWEKGYAATSVPDLLEATGLSRSSLYDTFGDKASLFEAATGLYTRVYGTERVEALRHAVGTRKGLIHFFKLIIDSCLDPESPGGCLMTNTAVSLESREAHIDKLLKASAQGLYDEFRGLLVRGQKSGEVAPNKNVDALSHLLVSVTYGINVMARINPRQDVLQPMADSAIAAVF